MPATTAGCLNCGSALVGAYCGECGQQARDPDPTFRELIDEVWDAFVSVDGRVLSSLRLLLLRPGVLTVEYLRGRRTRYLAPLRLYLICSVAFFLVSSFEPDHATSDGVAIETDAGADVDFSFNIGAADSAAAGHRSRVRAADLTSQRDSVRRVTLAQRGFSPPAGPLDSAMRWRADSMRLKQQIDEMHRAPAWFRARLAHGVLGLKRDKHDFGREYAAQLPRLMFVLMPAFALLLAVAYRSRHRRYPVHLIVALHLHAFAFALLTLEEVRLLIPWPALGGALKAAAAIWFVLYVPLALRRVYGGRIRYAALRAIVLGSEYALLGTVVYGLMAFVLLLTY